MKNFDQDIEPSLKVLYAGGLILYPTDTIWGIGCDATNPKAVEKIYAVKNRPGAKALIVLVADERTILQHVAAPDLSLFDFLDKRDQPTTVIYEGAIGFADNLLAEDGSIAIRICKDEFCQHLLRRFRKPIVSTSANISGQPFPTDFSTIDPAIINGVDYVVQYRQEEQFRVKPSSIITWKNGEVEWIRP